MSDDKSKGGTDPKHEMMTPETLKESLGELASNIDSLVDNLTMDMQESRPDDATVDTEHPFDELPPDMANVVVAATSDDAVESVDATETIESVENIDAAESEMASDPVGSLEVTDDEITLKDEQDTPVASLAQMAAAAPSATFESAAETAEQNDEKLLTDAVVPPVDEETLSIEVECPTESTPEAMASEMDDSIADDPELVGLAEGLIDSVHTLSRDASGNTRPKQPIAGETVRPWMNEAITSQHNEEGDSFDVFDSETEQSQEDTLLSAEVNDAEAEAEVEAGSALEAAFETEAESKAESGTALETAFEIVPEAEAQSETALETAFEIVPEAEAQSETALDATFDASEPDATPIGAESETSAAEIDDELSAEQKSTTASVIPWSPSEATAGSGGGGALWKLAAVLAAVGLLGGGWVVWNGRGDKTVELTELAPPVNRAAQLPPSNVILESASQRTDQARTNAAGIFVQRATTDTAPAKTVSTETSAAGTRNTTPPVASKPVASKPVASKSVASKSVASKPAASKPVASKPAASKPVASKPAASKPVASKPVASKPVASKPVASKPVASKPVASKPVASKPVASKPVASKPVASKPVASKPVASNSSTAKPTATSTPPSQNAAAAPKQVPAPTRPTEVASSSTPVVPRNSVAAPKPTVTDSIALTEKPVETVTERAVSPAPTTTAKAQPQPQSPDKTSTTNAARGSIGPPTPVVTEPKLLTRGKAEYSERARKRGEAGVIELRLLVGTTGRVKRVVVEHGIPGSELEASAINAALRSSYEPARSGGEPVEAWTNERFVFEP